MRSVLLEGGFGECDAAFVSFFQQMHEGSQAPPVIVAAQANAVWMVVSSAPFQWFSRIPQQRSIGLYLLW